MIFFGTDGSLLELSPFPLLGRTTPTTTLRPPQKSIRPKTDRLRATSSTFLLKMWSRLNSEFQCEMSCVPKPTSSVPKKHGSSQKGGAFVPKMIGLRPKTSVPKFPSNLITEIFFWDERLTFGTEAVYFWDGGYLFWDGRSYFWDERYFFGDGATFYFGFTASFFGTVAITFGTDGFVFGTDDHNFWDGARSRKHFLGRRSVRPKKNDRASQK